MDEVALVRSVDVRRTRLVLGWVTVTLRTGIYKTNNRVNSAVTDPRMAQCRGAHNGERRQTAAVLRNFATIKRGIS